MLNTPRTANVLKRQPAIYQTRLRTCLRQPPHRRLLGTLLGTFDQKFKVFDFRAIHHFRVQRWSARKTQIQL